MLHINMQDVHKWYGRSTRCAASTLTVARGERLAICGPSVGSQAAELILVHLHRQTARSAKQRVE